MGRKTITRITNTIKARHAIPENWTRGAIVYIYKNKGGAWECGYYRPICLTQTIYKIWPWVITRKLTKIMQIPTRNNQFAYKEGISMIAAIVKVEKYIENASRDAKILLMDLSKAVDTINRTLLRTTLYKKGIPIEMTNHIRQGHHGTKLPPKYKGRYGAPSPNNIGVSQGSAISALLFIIYMDEVMADNAALNRR